MLAVLFGDADARILDLDGELIIINGFQGEGHISLRRIRERISHEILNEKADFDLVTVHFFKVALDRRGEVKPLALRPRLIICTE